MIRRLKKDVLTQLPEKTRVFVPLEIDNRTDYMNAETDFIEYIRNRKGAVAADRAGKAEHLVQTEALKQMSVHGKIKQVISWLDDFLDTDEKIVVFAVHHAVIDELMEHFKKVAVRLDGRMSAQEKDNAVTRFQEKYTVRMLIGNIKAAGIGYTLTAASNVAIIELPWTPGELIQAEDRCHRIGQDNAVTIHYLLAQDTIEEKMARLLDKKAAVIGAVLDGKDIKSESLLTELINEYLN
jgi:SNF2 family DNA or RNA helicase